MPQAFPHRREVAVLFKLLFYLLVAVACKVQVVDLPDRFRLRLVDDVFRPHLVVAEDIPIFSLKSSVKRGGRLRE